MNVSIDNQSNRTIKSISVMLVQNITYIARRQRKKMTDVVAKLELVGCEVSSKSERKFNNLRLRIPATCPSLLESCEIIKNNYEIQLKVDASGLCKAKYLKIPIDIGTVPLDMDKLSNLEFEKKQSRGINNDGEIKMTNHIDFYDPLYPVYS